MNASDIRFARLLSVALVAACPAAAQDIVPPAAFEAFAEGRTLHFTRNGHPFGAERFFAGRRSLWRFVDGTCAEGRWYDEGDAICFVYEDSAAPICWHLTNQDGAHRAWLIEDALGTGLVLDLAGIDDAALDCPGPDVGS